MSDITVPISVDTMKTEVMRAALDRGASMINDITALAAPGALELLARSDAAVCLMHMQGAPRTMQVNPTYTDVVGEVSAFLAARAAAAQAAKSAALSAALPIRCLIRPAIFLWSLSRLVGTTIGTKLLHRR